LARGLLHFALCKQGLWLDLCHAVLLLIPRTKGELVYARCAEDQKKPSSIKQHTPINISC
jgi:hypothetical protein